MRFPLFAFCALASWSAAQDLDEAYTLGRLTGSSSTGALLMDSHAGTTTLASAFDFRVGAADRWALDLPLALATASKDSRSVNLYQLPGARLGLHPTPGLMLDAQLMSSNLWVLTSSGDGANGFDEGVPKVLHSDLFAHWLSQDGRIALDGNTAPFAFLYGPRVGAGQLDLSGRWSGTHIDTSEIRGYDFKAAYGLAPGLQGWAEYSDTLRKDIYRSSYWNSVNRYVTQTLGLGADWVSSHARAGGNLRHIQPATDGTPDLSDLGTLETWSLGAYLGYQDGARQPTAAEVAGNWNGFFTPHLAKGQYDLEGNVWIAPTTSQTNVQISGNLRYGLLDQLTVGFEPQLSFAYTNDQTFFLSACLSNIPRRTKGPHEVSALEYQTGYLPRAGEGRLLARVMLPGSDWLTGGTAQALQLDPQARYESPWERSRRGWSRDGQGTSDVRLEGLAGLSDAFFLQADLARVDFFGSTLAGAGSYDVKKAWVLGLGLAYHTEATLVQVRLPWYTGKGNRYWNGVSGDVQDGMDSRFGPVELQFRVNY